jgi:hypothetical protein
LFALSVARKLLVQDNTQERSTGVFQFGVFFPGGKTANGWVSWRVRIAEPVIVCCASPLRSAF